MTRTEAYDFLDRTARALAEMFGSSCETLIQDMSLPTHPILAIYNGHVSGRSVGSTMDILGTARELDETAARTDFVNLYATMNGKQIKTSTLHLIGDDYNLALGVNFDYTSLVFANRVLVDLISADADLQSALWQGQDHQLADTFDECLGAVGKPIGDLTKADRMKIIALLDQKNAFSFRKSVPFVSKRLQVSRYTVYKYLGELAETANQESSLGG
ncbi:MAG: helix-turn-helix transcriptional regulator [Oscillospiraceae bacterium]